MAPTIRLQTQTGGDFFGSDFFDCFLSVNYDCEPVLVDEEEARLRANWKIKPVKDSEGTIRLYNPLERVYLAISDDGYVVLSDNGYGDDTRWFRTRLGKTNEGNRKISLQSRIGGDPGESDYYDCYLSVDPISGLFVLTDELTNSNGILVGEWETRRGIVARRGRWSEEDRYRDYGY